MTSTFDGKTRFRFEVGLFLRRKVLKVLKQMAWDEGVDYTLDHDGGWLSRNYYVTANGERGSNLSQRFMYWIKNGAGEPVAKEG